MKREYLCLVFFLSFGACSHLTKINDFNSAEDYHLHINNACKSEKALIEFRDSTISFGYSPEIRNDTLFWIDKEDSINISPLKNIYSISHRLNTEGLINGLIIGGGVGFGFSQLGGGSNKSGNLGSGGLAAAGSFIGSVIGGLIGVENKFILVIE